MKDNLSNKILGSFYGQAIGDALGVPVEFKSREYLFNNPIKDFIGYGCWNQPAGTFSDDSSMMFCTAESLCHGYDLEDIGQKFVQWMQKGYWGAHDKVFDIGGTTRNALTRIRNGEKARFNGEFDEFSNGNGSLMRIIPLAFYLVNVEDIEKRYQMVKEVSSITHAHFRSVFSCFIYIEFAILLIKGLDKWSAYEEMKEKVNHYSKSQGFNLDEVMLFDKVLDANINDATIIDISSSGYVLDSLESSLWCLLKYDSFGDSVLKAVNLGGDTDTTGAITGAIAGILYGMEGIYPKWIIDVAKSTEIGDLAERFYDSLQKKEAKS